MNITPGFDPFLQMSWWIVTTFVALAILMYYYGEGDE